MLTPPPIDLDLLAYFNRPGTPWLDGVMEAASNRWLLIGVAVLCGLYIWRKSPHGLFAAILFGVAIGAADLVSVRLVKPQVARIRPCKADPKHVVFPLGCGSGQSFPSSHASDTAAAAAILTWAAPKLSPVFIALTILIGISRVYLGVHWPTDVLGGWALGAAIGMGLLLLNRLRYAAVRS